MVLQINEARHKWISAHLFYAADLNVLLKNLILPVISSLRSKEKLIRYFFIRYNEQGVHVRLRLLVVEEHEIYLKQELIKQSIGFFQSYPSIREQTGTATNKILYPNDSLHFIDYCPEIERYGNSETIASAELNFESSSEVVLANISAEGKAWNISKVLITALRIHMAFFRSMDLRLHDMINICCLFINQWVPSLYNVENQASTERQTFLALFNEKFLSHKKGLIPAIQQLMDEISAAETADFPLIRFYNANKQVKLEYHKQRFSESRLYTIFCSFLHMTHNRLGMSNYDEAYLMYMIYRSLRLILEDDEGKEPNT